MVLAWQKWCKLCGTVPRVPFPDLREEHTLLDVAMRCFSISVNINIAACTSPWTLYMYNLFYFAAGKECGRASVSCV